MRTRIFAEQYRKEAGATSLPMTILIAIFAPIAFVGAPIAIATVRKVAHAEAPAHAEAA